MAKPKFTRILSTTSGLNNAVDPAMLSFDFRTGETELAQAVDVDIDSSGRPSRRLGRTPINSDNAKYGFSYGDVCLYVSGSTLYQLTPGGSKIAIRSDLTTDRQMVYAPVAGRIYYMNGLERGFVFEGKNYTWSKGDYEAPGDDRRTLSDPPSGNLLGWFAARMLVAKENVIFASEPSLYGVFDLHGGVRLLPNKITMMHSTSQGLWVGTTHQILFLRGQQWDQSRREIKASFGVIEGTDAKIPGDFSELTDAAIFTTNQGICIGTDSGELKVVTKNKLIIPSGNRGSAAVLGNRYIVMIHP